MTVKYLQPHPTPTFLGVEDEIEYVAARYRVWGLARDRARLEQLRRDLSMAQEHPEPPTTSGGFPVSLGTLVALLVC